MAQIGKYTVMLVVAFFLSAFAHWTNSDYLTAFFAQNAILLGVTVFTIHAAAVGILMSQLEILRSKARVDFTSTIKGIRNSFSEALVFLTLIMICAIALSPKRNFTPTAMALPFSEIWLPAFLVFFVIGLLDIVRDTVNAILMCLEGPHDADKGDQK